jgi:hypothetical protein
VHAGVGDAEGGVVSQMWEGVARMTQLAKERTQSFLEGSVLLNPPSSAGVHFCTPLECWRLG